MLSPRLMALLLRASGGMKPATSLAARIVLLASAAAGIFALAACSSEEPAPGADDQEVVSGFGADCDISSVLCRSVQPRCPEGQTVTAKNGCWGECKPIAQCKPGSFDCRAGGPALCEIVPPQCAAGETLTTRNGCFGPCVPSAVCKGAPPAPSAGTADCDISRVACRITTPRCPEGKTPTVDADGFCYGECVDIAQCKPKSFECERGGPALCRIVPPTCAAGERITTEDGCYGPCVPEGVCK